LVQGMIFMTLGSDTSLPLRRPSLSYINPAACFSYEDVFDMKQDTGSPSSTLLLQPTRPWLSGLLAGTPLAELLSSGHDSASDRGRSQWAGYYTIADPEDESAAGRGQDPPMFLELYHAPQGPFCLNGSGHDGVGPFVLQGTVNILTGEVHATKVYNSHQWRWEGMVTPFGMAGIWKSGEGLLLNTRTWWWIWPQEWSTNENPTTTGAD